MTGPTTAVLLMAYGTPRRPEDIEAYYTDVRRGRPPPPELLDDLVRRYAAIGGVSPLLERTEAQAAGLRRALEARAPGVFRVDLGLKHAAPFIEDTVVRVAREGVRRIVGLVLAPHYSAFSVGQYLGRARERAARLRPMVEVLGIEEWHLEPAYLDFLTDQVAAGLAALPPRTKVLFSAHSLPSRIVDLGDPYPDQLRETAEAVVERLGGADWATAWQSAGRTPEPWLGPDVRDVIREVAETGEADGVLVCPCGFVSDHLEILYDLDLEARAVADEVGIAFARTAVVNDDAAVLGALAARVVTTVLTTPVD
jgi:ferrochelatase